MTFLWTLTIYLKALTGVSLGFINMRINSGIQSVVIKLIKTERRNLSFVWFWIV